MLVARELDFQPYEADDISSLYFMVEDDRFSQADQCCALVRIRNAFAHCYACDGSTQCEHANVALKAADTW